jgi:hypothetical protein
MKTRIQTAWLGMAAMVILSPFHWVCGQESPNRATVVDTAKASRVTPYHLAVQDYERMQPQRATGTNLQRFGRYTRSQVPREDRSLGSVVPHALSSLGHANGTSREQRPTVVPRPSSGPYGYRGQPATTWAVETRVPPRVPVRSVASGARSARGIGAWLAALLGGGAWAASRTGKGS